MSSLNAVFIFQTEIYLEDVDFTGRAVDVELAIGRIVWVDTLASQEVDNVLCPVFVTIGGCHLYVALRLVDNSGIISVFQEWKSHARHARTKSKIKEIFQSPCRSIKTNKNGCNQMKRVN